MASFAVVDVASAEPVCHKIPILHLEFIVEHIRVLARWRPVTKKRASIHTRGRRPAGPLHSPNPVRVRLCIGCPANTAPNMYASARQSSEWSRGEDIKSEWS
jgi:hypothetical protein